MRIIDLSRLLPGPFATLCLQGLGADVIKIEDPKGGDYLRHFPPTLHGTGAWFAALNRGKRSVALDLKAPEGRAGLLALLREADVLVESFRPGVMTRLGLDPLELCGKFPTLVVASLTGWGQTGPLAALPGHDIGFLSLAGMLGSDPRVPRMQWGDLAAGGLVAALRILAAHHAGSGGWLDIAMLDGLVGLQQTQFAQLVAGASADEMLTGGFPAYGVYCCADGRWISLGALEPQFSALLTMAGAETTAAGLTTFFARRPRDEWMELLGDACVVPVLGLDEVAAHPHVAVRGLFDASGLPFPPTGPVTGAVPALGAHTADELARAGYRTT